MKEAGGPQEEKSVLTYGREERRRSDVVLFGGGTVISRRHLTHYEKKKTEPTRVTLGKQGMSEDMPTAERKFVTPRDLKKLKEERTKTIR